MDFTEFYHRSFRISNFEGIKVHFCLMYMPFFRRGSANVKELIIILNII